MTEMFDRRNGERREFWRGGVEQRFANLEGQLCRLDKRVTKFEEKLDKIVLGVAGQFVALVLALIYFLLGR